MKTVYKSKVDKGLLIAIIAIVLLSYLPLLFEFSWIALALLVVTAAFIADPFCNTSYTIDNGTLHIKCGIFLSSSFPIDRITKISKTNSCLGLIDGQDRNPLRRQKDSRLVSQTEASIHRSSKESQSRYSCKATSLIRNDSPTLT